MSTQNAPIRKAPARTASTAPPREVSTRTAPPREASTSNGFARRAPARNTTRKMAPSRKAKKTPEKVKTSPPEFSEGRYERTESVCVKVANLRDRYDENANLKSWIADPLNYLTGRAGRLFIGSKDDKEHFSYDCSIFANPYKVNAKMPLVVSLVKYINHLVSNQELFDQIPNLMGLNLGCFCDQSAHDHGLCHSSILTILANNFDSCKDNKNVYDIFQNIYRNNGFNKRGNDNTDQVLEMFGLSESVSNEDFVAKVEASFKTQDEEDYHNIDMDRLSVKRPSKENRYYTVKQLREICSCHSIGIGSNMKKAELVEVINEWVDKNGINNEDDGEDEDVAEDDVEEEDVAEEDVEEEDVAEEEDVEENQTIGEVIEVYDENEDIDDDKNDIDDASSEANEDEEKERDPDYVDGEDEDEGEEWKRD